MKSDTRVRRFIGGCGLGLLLVIGAGSLRARTTPVEDAVKNAGGLDASAESRDPAGAAQASDQAAIPKSLSDLPLIEVRATGPGRDILAFHLTGDGGYGVTDKGLASELAAKGIPVVVLSSFKYFWSRKTPEKAAADLARILHYYLSAWEKRQVVLIGYSLGADVMPFMVNRLPEDLQAVVRVVVFMGPSETVEFKFHLTDWLGRTPGKDALQVVPEINRIRPGIAFLCVYGEKDESNVCNKLDPSRTRSVGLPTAHRFGGDYAPIAKAVLESIRDEPPPPGAAT